MHRIAVDIRDLNIAQTGTKTFLEGLCAEFKKPNPEFEFHFLTTSKAPYTGTNNFKKIEEHCRYFFWKQISLPLKAKKLNCSVVFCSDYFVPYFKLGYETIAMFHDAFFAEYPSHYHKWWLILFNSVGLAAAKKARYIATPTNYTKNKIQYYYGLEAAKIKVVYEAGKPMQQKSTESTENAETVESSKRLIKDDYLLHVGTYEKRKNLPRLIQAFKLLNENGYPTLKLVLVGKKSEKPTLDDSEAIKQLIQKHQLQQQVIQVGYVSDQQLAGYYQQALLYIFPSVNEGFGIPVLEAFAHKVPVLIANNSCLPEVAGDAAILFNPLEVSDMYQQIKRVLDHPSLQQELKQKGEQQLLKYSWEKTAGILLALFKTANQTINKKINKTATSK